MQLNLFNDLHALEQGGFTLEKTFKPSNNNGFKKLESTWSVFLNGKIVMYVQDNYDGTYDTLGFYHERNNVNLKEVIEIVKNKNNWCLYTRIEQGGKDE